MGIVGWGCQPKGIACGSNAPARSELTRPGWRTTRGRLGRFVIHHSLAPKTKMSYGNGVAAGDGPLILFGHERVALEIGIVRWRPLLRMLPVCYPCPCEVRLHTHQSGMTEMQPTTQWQANNSSANTFLVIVSYALWDDWLVGGNAGLGLSMRAAANWARLGGSHRCLERRPDAQSLVIV